MTITSRRRALRNTLAIAIGCLVLVSSVVVLHPRSLPTAASTTTPAVTLHRSGPVLVGHSIRLWGTVRGAKPGHQMLLQRRSGTAWRTFARPRLRSDLTYSARWTPRSVGQVRLRTVRVATPGIRRAVSPVLRLTAVKRLTIAQRSLPKGVVGALYSVKVRVLGAALPVRFSASGLPAGLRISSAGRVYGTPVRKTTKTVTITARDGIGQVAHKTFTLAVTPTGSSGRCTAPVYSTTAAQGTWKAGKNTMVNNNVWGASGSNWSQRLDVCSKASWNVTGNFSQDGGAIQSYPDTEYDLPDRSIANYNTITTCFGEESPTNGEWDYGYDMWLGDDASYNDHWQIEIMVWNDWTDTNIYPPSNARAVKIDGVGYHMWRGGGENEWIYTRDNPTKTGCVDQLGIFKDLVAHPSTSGITNKTVPWSIEYGVEIASTKGSETFRITNSTLATS